MKIVCSIRKRFFYVCYISSLFPLWVFTFFLWIDWFRFKTLPAKGPILELADWHFQKFSFLISQRHWTDIQADKPTSRLLEYLFFNRNWHTYKHLTRKKMPNNWNKCWCLKARTKQTNKILDKAAVIIASNIFGLGYADCRGRDQSFQIICIVKGFSLLWKTF